MQQEQLVDRRQDFLGRLCGRGGWSRRRHRDVLAEAGIKHIRFLYPRRTVQVDQGFGWIDDGDEGEEEGAQPLGIGAPFTGLVHIAVPGHEMLIDEGADGGGGLFTDREPHVDGVPSGIPSGD